MDNTADINQYIIMGDPIQSEAPTFEKKQEPAGPKWYETSIMEKIAAVAIWPISFCYSNFVFSSSPEWKISFGIFVMCLVVLTEALYFKRKRSAESWIFMVLTLVSTVSTVFPIGSVWDEGYSLLFTHLFAAYWILSRSDRLAEGETSHMFLWDGITAFFVMTFKNFHLNVRTIVSIFYREKTGERKKRNVWGAIAGIAIGLILLAVAVSRLKSADDNFANLMETVADALRIDIDGIFVLKCFMTTFLSMYLFGLLGGCYRETRAHVEGRSDNIKHVIEALRKIPGVVWVVLIGLFTVYYLIFFGLQGSYLFDAFRMHLPTQFTFSEYARKGFGDMCGVMAVNFIVTWLTIRTSQYGDNEGIKKAVKIASACLTVESIFFAVIAGLKLLMYINAYGYTPLRLQSAWLVVVLFAACICVLVNMFSGKKTARAWFIGSSITLAALCLV